MATIDYKEKYGQALEKARNIVNSINVGLIGKDSFEAVFPELRESEDERMWKLIKKYAHCNISDMALNADHITREQLESWLEKKGEQKSTSVLDIEIPFGAKDSELQEATYYIPKDFHAEIDDDKVVIKKGKKQTSLSEEDEAMINSIIRELIHQYNEEIPQCTEDKIKWLKNKLKFIKPQSQWKPSEEMLEALYKVIPQNVMEISEDEMLLDKLYQGLKYGRVLSKKELF